MALPSRPRSCLSGTSAGGAEQSEGEDRLPDLSGQEVAAEDEIVTDPEAATEEDQLQDTSLFPPGTATGISTEPAPEEQVHVQGQALVQAQVEGRTATSPSKAGYVNTTPVKVKNTFPLVPSEQIPPR